MASGKRSLTLPEAMAGTLLVTIGAFGLLGRLDMLVGHPNAGSQPFQWWPLVLVALGVMQLSAHWAKEQSRRK